MSRPIVPDLWDYSDETRLVIGGLVSGRIRIVDLVEVDPGLFAEVKEEALGLIERHEGQPVEGDHPTAAYIRAQDPNWRPTEVGLVQYSLYNSANSLTYNEDDHHWSEVERRFNDELPAIPRFYARYFGESELQNFRLQLIRAGGSLGQHRERIVGIPHREAHYKVRFHLPIITNPAVRFVMEGQEFLMPEGHVYLFNQACMHGVRNGGDLRVHLLWDVYLNEQLIEKLIYGPCSAEGAG